MCYNTDFMSMETKVHNIAEITKRPAVSTAVTLLVSTLLTGCSPDQTAAWLHEFSQSLQSPETWAKAICTTPAIIVGFLITNKLLRSKKPKV